MKVSHPSIRYLCSVLENFPPQPPQFSLVPAERMVLCYCSSSLLSNHDIMCTEQIFVKGVQVVVRGAVRGVVFSQHKACKTCRNSEGISAIFGPSSDSEIFSESRI